MENLIKGLNNYFNVVLKQFFKYEENYTINYYTSINSFYIRPYYDRVTFWNNLSENTLSQIINNLTLSIQNKYSNYSVIVSVEKNAIIIRYDTIKLDQLNEPGIYANIASNLNSNEIHNLLTATKNITLYKVYNNNDFWIELIKIKFNNYLKPVTINFNYKYIYKGLINYDKMLEYQESVDYLTDDSDNEEDNEDFCTMNMFYTDNKYTLKYLITTELLELNLLHKVFKLKELYKSDNTYLLKIVMDKLKDESNFSKVKLLYSDCFDTYITIEKIINLANLLAYSLMYSDTIFLESVYDFIIQLLDNKNNFNTLIDDTINIISIEFEFINESNFDWLLNKLSSTNINYTFDVLSWIVNSDSTENADLIEYIIKRLPSDISNDMLSTVTDSISLLNSIGSASSAYYILDKYMSRLSNDYREDTLILLLEDRDYDNILLLILKYKDLISSDFLDYLKEECEEKLNKKWSKDLSELFNYLKGN